MPNTLAHIGVQTLALAWCRRSGSAAGVAGAGAGFGWILAGCLIPDLPWILQRGLRALPFGIDPYDLRLYAIAQSSLLVSLCLALALAALTPAWKRAFGVLALGCLLHLLLDALQIKTANGVHLFAPWSWELLSFRLFWPGSWQSQTMTLLGAAVAVWVWRQPVEPLRYQSLTPGRLCAGLLALAFYGGLPIALMSGPEQADNHAVKTLRETETRAGRSYGFDRERYRTGPDGPRLSTLAGEELHVVGEAPSAAATLSGRARFVDSIRIELSEVHDHRDSGRDLASYLGLAYLGSFAIRAAWTGRRGAARVADAPQPRGEM